ncbi:MAG TPA: phosphonoacetate hydrolase [Kiloniellales bacterium]|nr:phosphonoacetate hydrolase [Kiloniellales bacterium]
MTRDVRVNGRVYAWPKRPTVVVCLDGSAPAYHLEAIKAGHMPFLAQAIRRGADLRADCVIPSFTNPNNLSIVTGAPPAVHGISGNFFLDPDSGQEVMMNDPKFLRAETIFAAFQKAGGKVVVITAKDKLRALLGKGLTPGPDAICFSAEKADKTTLAANGIENALAFVGLPLPEVYSADLSAFIFAAGVKLMRRDRPDLMYLSTTDYIQHKHAPGTAVANDFYAMIDRHLAELDAAGAAIVLTADHGMNAKHDRSGRPDVIFLQDLLDEWIGAGPGDKKRARVILPITDPYVVHHGALGSYAVIHLPEELRAEAAERIRALPGIELVLSRAEACERFSLPADRTGDLVVVSATSKVLGSSAAKHDLSGLTEPLRSHGGISEREVPLISTRPIAAPPARRLRNYDAFDLALNYVL